MKKFTFFFCALMLCLSARANYYIVGDFNGWTVANAIELTTTDGTNYTVQLDTLWGGFKITTARDWNHVDYGASSGSNLFSVGQTMSLVSNASGNNYNVNISGGYSNAVLTLSISGSACQITFVSAGDAVSSYYVIGDYNEWSLETAAAMTTTDGVNYTTQISSLWGAFKILPARDWNHGEYVGTTTDCTCAVGQTIALNLVTNGFGSDNDIHVPNNYSNAVLSFAITNNTPQLTFVSGTVQSSSSDSTSNSTYYIVGDFNNWDVTNAVEMTTTDGVLYYVHLDTLYGGFKITNARDWNHLNWGANDSENSFSYVYNGYDRYFTSLKTNENWEYDPNYNILTDQGYSNVTLGLYINNNAHDDEYQYYLWFDKVTHTGMKFYENNLLYQITNLSPTQVRIINNYISSPTDLVIPSSINYNGIDFAVTAIGNRAFFNCTNLTSVVLPNSLTCIGTNAFCGCSNAFTSLVISENVDTIGSYAFFGCNNLTLVIWNARNCVNMGYWDGFYYNFSSPFSSSVQTFIFGDNVQTIPNYLCYGLTQLTSIALPNTVTKIGESAFRNCSGLISFTMENGVQTIGDHAFSDCSNLPQIVLPNTVTKIDESAFYNCRNLTTAIVGNSIDTIGCYAFMDCERLISIELPATVTIMGDRAFVGCSAMNKVIVHSTTQLPSYGGLIGNPQIDTIIAPASIFDFVEADWHYCTKKIKYVRVNSGELTENGLAVIRRSASTLETLDVAATTNTTLSDEAFSNMYNLTTLALPQNLGRISYMAVAGCKMLPSISIPATVTEIGTSAFEHCRSLQTVTFNGNNLTTIGNWAFYNNHALQQLTIPAGVTTIGAGAFYGCTYLEDLAMPASLRNVGDNAFALCNHLTKMQVEADLPPMVAARTFFDVSRNIPVYVPDEAVNDYRNTAIWQEFFIRPISQAATGIETVRESDSDSQNEMLPDGKFFQNGKLLIRRNGKTYDAQGRLIR